MTAITTKTSNRGAPKKAPHLKRVAITIKLPQWQVNWLRAQPEKQSRIIEAALLAAHDDLIFDRITYI